MKRRLNSLSISKMLTHSNIRPRTRSFRIFAVSHVEVVSEGGCNMASKTLSALLKNTRPNLKAPSSSKVKNILHGVGAKIITPTDKEKVIEFLAQHYYPYEPLNISLKVEEKPEATQEQSELFLKRTIDDQCSYMLVNNENKIVSVILNKIERKGAFTPWTCKNELVCKLAKFYTHVQMESLIVKKFDIDAFINIEAMVVDLHYVGKGFVQRMVGITKDLAAEKKIKLITYICTSNYTALSATKAGFIAAFKLNYMDYQVDGKPVFNPKPPHNEVQVFALSIMK